MVEGKLLNEKPFFIIPDKNSGMIKFYNKKHTQHLLMINSEYVSGDDILFLHTTHGESHRNGEAILFNKNLKVVFRSKYLVSLNRLTFSH